MPLGTQDGCSLQVQRDGGQVEPTNGKQSVSHIAHHAF
jgi:hypothetical protein